MLSEQEKANMKKYRHLIACLIDCSIGYFTPLAALRAIEEHKGKRPYFCEWYMDIAGKRLRREGKNRFSSREEEAQLYKEINKDIIRDSLRYRKHKECHKKCLAIVDRNIGGAQSLGASWF